MMKDQPINLIKSYYIKLFLTSLIFIASLMLSEPVRADRAHDSRIRETEAAYHKARDQWRKYREQADLREQQTRTALKRHKVLQDEFWSEHAKTVSELHETMGDEVKALERLERQKQTLIDQAQAKEEAWRDILSQAQALIEKENINRIVKLKHDRLMKRLDEIQVERDAISGALIANLSAQEVARDHYDREIIKLRNKVPGMARLKEIGAAFDKQMKDRARPVLEEEQKNAASTAFAAATNYLDALIAAPPPTLEWIEVRADGEVVYEAELSRDISAKATELSSHETQLIRRSIAKSTERRDEIDKTIAELEERWHLHNREWLDAYAVFRDSDAKQLDNDINVAYATGAVEMAGVAVAAVISGGIAAPAALSLGAVMQSGAKKVATSSVGRSLGKVAKAGSESIDTLVLALADKVGMTDQAIATLRRIALLKRHGKLTEVEKEALFSIASISAAKRLNIHLNDRDAAYLSFKAMPNWAGTIVGDAIETTLTDTSSVYKVGSAVAANAKNIVTTGRLASTAVAAGTTTASGAGSLADAKTALTLAAATTGVKVALQVATNWRNGILQERAATALATSAIAHQLTRELSGEILRLKVERQWLHQRLHALEQVEKFGRHPLQVSVLKQSRIARDVFTSEGVEIRFRFSQPVVFTPSISAPSLKFNPPEKIVGTEKQTFLTEAKTVGLESAVIELPLSISLHDSEAPHNALDSNPRTPARLASLSRNGWQGYESGPDQNHTILLQSTTPEKLWVAYETFKNCEAKTEHRVINAPPSDADWTIAGWTMIGVQMCQRYNPITGKCMDGTFAVTSSSVLLDKHLCLKGNGDVFIQEDGTLRTDPYPVLTWYNTHHPSCIGAQSKEEIIARCPSTRVNPNRNGLVNLNGMLDIFTEVHKHRPSTEKPGDISIPIFKEPRLSPGVRINPTPAK